MTKKHWEYCSCIAMSDLIFGVENAYVKPSVTSLLNVLGIDTDILFLNHEYNKTQQGLGLGDIYLFENPDKSNKFVVSLIRDIYEQIGLISFGVITENNTPEIRKKVLDVYLSATYKIAYEEMVQLDRIKRQLNTQPITQRGITHHPSLIINGEISSKPKTYFFSKELNTVYTSDRAPKSSSEESIPTISEKATELMFALQMGLTSEDEILIWVDQMVLEMEEPPLPLVELCQIKKTSHKKIIEQLKTLSNDIHFDKPLSNVLKKYLNQLPCDQQIISRAIRGLIEIFEQLNWDISGELSAIASFTNNYDRGGYGSLEIATPTFDKLLKNLQAT